MDYEFTTVFDLDINHNAICTKDRTSMFGQTQMKLTEATGKAILQVV
jgi:hypothetical protein